MWHPLPLKSHMSDQPLAEYTTDELFDEIQNRYDATLLMALVNSGGENERVMSLSGGAAITCLGLAQLASRRLADGAQDMDDDEMKDWEQTV